MGTAGIAHGQLPSPALSIRNFACGACQPHPSSNLKILFEMYFRLVNAFESQKIQFSSRLPGWRQRQVPAAVQGELLAEQKSNEEPSLDLISTKC